jgi:hypothetical protein
MDIPMTHTKGDQQQGPLKAPEQPGMLRTYAQNVTSQFGENGILEETLRRIGTQCSTDNWCAEVGASDGIYLSNTYPLISQRAFSAVLIEANATKYRELCMNMVRGDVHKICEFVSFDGSSALDELLARTPIPRDFDLLSIDIDGCDYFIFESLTRFTPKVVCIEYNESIPNDVEFVQPKDMSIRQGASARSISRLAGRKGYTLVSATTANLIWTSPGTDDSSGLVF